MTKATAVLITFVVTIVLSALLAGSSVGAFISEIFGIASQTQTESYDPSIDESEDIEAVEEEEELVTEDAVVEEDTTETEIETEPEAPVGDETDALPGEEESEETDVVGEGEAALEEIQTYLDYGPLSRQGIIETLSGEYGLGYSVEAAEYAADNADVDWNQSALESAQILLEGMPDLTKDEIYMTLTDVGMGYTDEEAQYAIDNLPDTLG